MSVKDKQREQTPEHLQLAAQWVSNSISQAQTTMLSSISERIVVVDKIICEQHKITDGVEKQHQTIEMVRRRDIDNLGEMVDQSCGQIERLGKLMDAVEKNLGELEDAMDKAEGAVGISIGGRLEQFAKMLGSSVSGGGASMGVPYLRQWADKDKAVPKVISTGEYLDSVHTPN